MLTFVYPSTSVFAQHAEELSTRSTSANGDSGNDSLIGCEDWLPLLPGRASRHDGDSGNGDYGVGDAQRGRVEGGDLSSSHRRGAAVVEALRVVLEEAHIWQVRSAWINILIHSCVTCHIVWASV